MQNIQRTQQDGGDSRTHDDDHEPWLVTECSDDPAIDDCETDDVEQRLETAGVPNQVELHIGVERQRQQEGSQHHDGDGCCQRHAVSSTNQIECCLQEESGIDDCKTIDEPFPSKCDRCERYTCKNGVRHCLRVLFECGLNAFDHMQWIPI